MTVHEQPTQSLSLGLPGAPGEECGAPLAADQRYCLNCGHRRGDARVDYRQVMAAPGPEAASPGPQAPQPPSEDGPAPGGGAKGERDFAPLAAVGGIAVLGLMLLVGVLIGKGNSTTTGSSAPQVVRVPASGASAEASGAETEATAETGGKAKKNANGGGSGGGKAAAKSQGLGGGGKEDDTVHEASSGELEELEGESGEDAAKKSLELPNKIATPGAPPPIDKTKPPGGGEGGGLVIK
jgi:hypothetical protein